MSSEFPHLQASQRPVAQLSNEERIDWIRQERWIQYPRAKRILERLSELVDYPPRHRMPCLAIYGSTALALLKEELVTEALVSIADRKARRLSGSI